MHIREQGWECPKCERVWAPKIAACGACNGRQTLPAREIPTYRTTGFVPPWDVQFAGYGRDGAEL